MKQGRSKLETYKIRSCYLKKFLKEVKTILSTSLPIVHKNRVNKWRNKSEQDLGKYPMIRVDLPFHNRFDINGSFETKEEFFSKIVANVPVLGRAYKLLSSGAYYVAGKTEISKERLPNGPTKEFAKIYF
ncbi:hypothetical protein Glove_26g301 [Diversispora epigaea]|uniref:Uncharacterized protein n=1 Tax=Diversispora epigaea TaxID=1348612 RepID=A0A397JS61_9GLOM|nr:hypothetical protein Glove_26g301 [Diversispora epigaea]